MIFHDFLDLSVAVPTNSLGAMHGAAQNAFAVCVRRLKRGAHRRFRPRGLSAALAQIMSESLRAHHGSCQSACKSVVFCIALSFPRADTSRERTNTQHSHINRTSFMLRSHRTRATLECSKSRTHPSLRRASRTPVRASRRVRHALTRRHRAAPDTASARAARRP